jgi:hypothetical protein
MGDDNIIDPTITSASTTDAAAAAGEVYKKTIDGLKTSLDALGVSEQKQNIALKTVKEGFSSLIPDGLNLKQLFESLSKSTGIDASPITNMFSGVGNQIGDVIKNVAGFSGALTALGDSTTRDFFNPIKQGGIEMLASFFPEDLAPKVLAVRDAAQAMLDVQNTSRVGFTRWQNSFLTTSTAIEKANDAASAYPQTIRRMSDAHVVSGATLDNMMKAFQGMPIILNQNEAITNNIVVAQSRMVDELGKLINVSQAFGMTEADATQRAKTGYMEFNQSVTETISSLATMEAASKATGIDRKIADDQIVSASKSLAIFGQKSDAAAGLWTTFTSSLKDTIPLKQIGDIVSDVTQKIAGMSVQNRAFISMMSGMSQGRSAMGGALQLEVAMRTPEGMEKNLQAMTSSLSQFAGGKIITLEEAANNPQLEIQFQLQRDMLGKISNISDPQAQNRVLEVLQKVQSGGMSQVEGGKELTSLMGKGSNIQERQLNALDQIANHTRAMAGEVLMPENQFEQIGNALLGRTNAPSDDKKGSARVRKAIRETPQENKLLKNSEVQLAMGKMFDGVSEGLSKVIRVDLIGAINDFKKIFDIGTESSKNKDLINQVPLVPSGEQKTIDARPIMSVQSKENIEKIIGPPPSEKENIEKIIGPPPSEKGQQMTALTQPVGFMPPTLQVPNIEPQFNARAEMGKNEAFANLNEKSIDKSKVSTHVEKGKEEISVVFKFDGSLPPDFKNFVIGEVENLANNWTGLVSGSGARYTRQV